MKIIGVKIEGRTGDENDFASFRLNDVNFIDMQRPRKSSDLVPVYHTTLGLYAPLLTLKDISAALKGYGFSYFDKSTIVNRGRIKRLAKSKCGLTITFVDNSETVVSARSRMK